VEHPGAGAARSPDPRLALRPVVSSTEIGLAGMGIAVEGVTWAPEPVGCVMPRVSTR